MKSKLFAMVLVMAVLAIGGTSVFANKASIDGVKCFFMPKKNVVEDKSVEWKDGKVYFCCPGCVKKFSGAKEEYAAKANHQLVATKQYEQKACPMSGGELNAEETVEVGGVKVAFCCGNCKAKAEKMEGDEQINALFGEEAFKKAKFEVVKEEKK